MPSPPKLTPEEIRERAVLWSNPIEREQAVLRANPEPKDRFVLAVVGCDLLAFVLFAGSESFFTKYVLGVPFSVLGFLATVLLIDGAVRRHRAKRNLDNLYAARRLFDALMDLMPVAAREIAARAFLGGSCDYGHGRFEPKLDATPSDRERGALWMRVEATMRREAEAKLGAS